MNDELEFLEHSVKLYQRSINESWNLRDFKVNNIEYGLCFYFSTNNMRRLCDVLYNTMDFDSYLAPMPLLIFEHEMFQNRARKKVDAATEIRIKALNTMISCQKGGHIRNLINLYEKAIDESWSIKKYRQYDIEHNICTYFCANYREDLCRKLSEAIKHKNNLCDTPEEVNRKLTSDKQIQEGLKNVSEIRINALEVLTRYTENEYINKY